MTPVRKIVLGAAIAAVALVAAIAVLVSTIDLRALVIGPLKSRVAAMTGRELTIRGAVDLSLLPTPKLTLHGVTIANAPWGKAPALAEIGSVEVDVGLAALLTRRFDSAQVTLVEPRIALEVNAAGERNWVGPALNKDPAAATGPLPAPETPTVNLAIRGGSVTYQADPGAVPTQVAIERFSVRMRSARDPMAAEFRGKVDGVDVALDGSLGPLDDLLARRWPYPIDAKGQIDGSTVALESKLKQVDRSWSLDNLVLVLGADRFTGTFTVTTGGARPRLDFALATPTLDWSGSATAGTGSVPPKSSTGRDWLFPATPVRLQRLRQIDAAGTFDIGRLLLSERLRLDHVKLQADLRNGRLDLRGAQATALGGTLALSGSIDAAPATPALLLRASGRGLELAAILAALGKPQVVTGGATEFNADLTFAGDSPRAWAASVTGNLRLLIGPATTSNPRLEVSGPIDTLMRTINPFRDKEANTRLECGVARLPFVQGVARIDHSVGFATNQMGATASGTLDLRNETVDLDVYPQFKSSIPLDLPQLATKVRLHGRLDAPEVSVSATASTASLAKLGAAIGTAGWSVLGTTLFKQLDGSTAGAGPCAVALGDTSAVAAAAKAASPARSVTREVGDALGRLFK